MAARILAATAGAYALASACCTSVALLVKTPREEAALSGALTAYLVFAAAALWAFSARTALRAWLGILMPLAILGGLTLWLSGTTSP